jgi:hypothetical protein
LEEFLFVAKMANIIRKNLAKSGYKPDGKHKTLIIPLYLWLDTQKKKKISFGKFFSFFPSLLAIKNLLKKPLHF